MAFEIVIGAAPRGMDLARDVELVKPALIYGDRIRLLSPAAATIQGIASVAYADGRHRLEIMKRIAHAIGDPEKVEQAEYLEGLHLELKQKGRRRTKGELLLLARIEAFINNAHREMQTKLEETLGGTKADEIALAIEAGLLEIEPLIEGDELDVDFTDEMIKTFMEKLHESLGGGSAFPLFDDEVGNILELQVKEGVFAPAAIPARHAKHAGLAAGLLSQLPAFPDASVSEILDIRDLLANPLVRFRAAVAEMADALRSPAYAKSFQPEVADVFSEKVAPALVELRETIEQNSNLRQLARTAMENKGAVSVLGLGIVASGQLPDLVAAAAAGTLVLAKAAWEQLQQTEKIQNDRLYLLHRSQEMLSNRRAGRRVTQLA